MKRLLSVIAVLCLFGSAFSGKPAGRMRATVTAESCSRGHIRAAQDRVRRGDVLIVPAGTCAPWKESLTWNAPADVVVQGPGDDKAVIVDDIDRTGNDAALWEIVTNNEGSFTMTGLTFKGSGKPTAASYNGSLRFYGNSKKFRFHHNHIVDLPHTSMATAGNLQGVVDHNVADLNASTFIRFRGVGEGDEAWAAPTDLGSDKFIFVETNKINAPSGFGVVQDSYAGSRFVIRYNEILNAGLQTHPTGGSGRARGTRAFEVYKNKFTANRTNFNFFFLSSGTGVVWGNDAPSGFSNFITLHSMRLQGSSNYQQFPPPEGWGYYKSVFDLDGTALDQPGTGQSDLLSGAFRGVKNMATGCTAPQPCVNPRQKIEPIYVWENVWATAGGGSLVAVYEGDVLKQGIHYVLRPKPGYTPYVYPHPLTVDAPAPAAPPQR